MESGGSVISPRFRFVVNSAAPPDAEAMRWLEATLANAIDQLRRHCVDETLSPGTLAHFTHIRSQIEPVESDAKPTWVWPR